MTKSEKRDFIPALGYDWLTKFYDLTIRLTMPEKEFRNKLIQYLDPKEKDTILEFGFGTGQNLKIAKQLSPKATFIGLDIDPKVKKIAEHNLNSAHLDISLELYDGRIFPFESEKFDKVYSSLVFHHLDTKTKKHCLNEIFRVLKPNGVLLIGDWGKPKTKISRLQFYLVQLFDGFKTTNENVKGLIPVFMTDCKFKNVKEIDAIKTQIGTYCYYKGTK